MIMEAMITADMQNVLSAGSIGCFQNLLFIRCDDCPVCFFCHFIAADVIDRKINPIDLRLLHQCFGKLCIVIRNHIQHMRQFIRLLLQPVRKIDRMADPGLHEFYGPWGSE
ncbi:Uncharacterised protein [Bacteroides xylanisolvens]|nr:Uncharacterised protein [Bacteroides xylanisolvens]